MQSNLDRIARFNPTLNAIVEVLAKEALASADAADAAKGGHKTGPPHGCRYSRCED
jgi:amidase